MCCLVPALCEKKLIFHLQDAIVEEVASANNNTIVIVNSVGPIIMESWIENPNGTPPIISHRSSLIDDPSSYGCCKTQYRATSLPALISSQLIRSGPGFLDKRPATRSQMSSMAMSIQGKTPSMTHLRLNRTTEMSTLAGGSHSLSRRPSRTTPPGSLTRARGLCKSTTPRACSLTTDTSTRCVFPQAYLMTFEDS